MEENKVSFEDLKEEKDVSRDMRKDGNKVRHATMMRKVLDLVFGAGIAFGTQIVFSSLFSIVYFQFYFNSLSEWGMYSMFLFVFFVSLIVFFCLLQMCKRRTHLLVGFAIVASAPFVLFGSCALLLSSMGV